MLILIATHLYVFLAQIRPGGETDLPLITAGNDVAHIANFLRPGRDSYSAAEVVGTLLDKPV